MAEKRYYWLKLNEDYFANPKIKKLRKIAGGDTFTIIYLKMQLLSVSNKGIITFEGIENTIEEELALKLDEQLEDVQLTMAYLQNQNLVECSDNEYLLIDACKNIGSEGESAERKRQFDERKRQRLLQSNRDVTDEKRSSISISNSISNNESKEKENIIKESFDCESQSSKKDCTNEMRDIGSEDKPDKQVNTSSLDSAKEKEIEDIYNYWNSLGKPTHKSLTDTFVKAIKKALKTYSAEEIKKAMSNYKTVLNDKDYFFGYEWGIDTFLKQSNCLPHFIDSGEKWINYCNKKGISLTKGQEKKEYNYDKNKPIPLEFG